MTGIELDSPAMLAGIQSGDIIVKIDKSEITSFADYIKALSVWNPEEEKTVYLMRQGQNGYKSAKVEVTAGSLK